MHHLDRDTRMPVDRADEVAALQRQGLDGVERHRAGRAWATIQDGHLAEIVAGTEERECDLLPIRAGDVDTHLALLDDIKHLARVVAVKDDLAWAEASRTHRLLKLAQTVYVQVGEEGHPSEGTNRRDAFAHLNPNAFLAGTRGG